MPADPPNQPHAIPDVVERPTAGTDDLRVAAVLDVLGGESVAEVAPAAALDPDLLQRWVRAFVAAGSAQVTNQPDTDAAQQRDRFLTAYAHETRTPLGAASGWAAMLRDDQLTEASRARVTARLCTALDRLAERIDEIELLAASSLGRLVLALEPVGAVELIERLGGGAEIVLAPSVPEGTTGTDPKQPTVEVDVARFSRVLRDLRQAASTDPAPRRVWWEVVLVDPWVELRARREADPIPVPVLQALFDPFDTNDDRTGVTMGLYLARALAVAHGGTIGVDQNETSAAFWVRIPARRNLDETGPVARS